MSQNDLPAIIICLASFWILGFSVGLEYGMRYTKYTRKDDDNASHSN